MFQTFIRCFFMIMVTTLLVSCVTQYQFYPGEKLSGSEIAILESDRGKNNNVRLLKIDGESGIPPENRFNREYRIELLPGEHTVEVMYRDRESSSKEPKTITQNFKAGEKYYILGIKKGFYRWDAYIMTNAEIDLFIETLLKK